MFHKSQSVIRPDEQNSHLHRVALRQVRKPKPMNSTKKKFTPRINSSFAEYDGIYSPKTRFRSTSVDRPRRASETSMPNVNYSTYDEQHHQSIANSAKKDMHEGRFAQAIFKFSQLVSLSDSVEAMYNRAICNISLKNVREATVDLLNIVKENSTYSRAAYLQLALCFLGMNEIEAALRYTTQAINRFSRFGEAFLMRAKLFLAKKNWEKARSDFKKYLKYNPNDEEAMVGISETFEKQGDYQNALKYLCEVSDSLAVLLKKAKAHFALESFESALKNIDLALLAAPTAEGYFLKAECHRKRQEYVEAGLSYEQCIKYDLDSELTSKAVCFLGAIKIREKDFYGAIHTFQRCVKNKTRDQKILEIYSDAVISLMKREYKEGVKVFNKLLKSKETIIEEYLGNCYCYRAYGYLALNYFEKAIRSLKKAQGFQGLDKASLYNQELAFALMHSSKLDFPKSVLRLNAAKKIFPRKSEPYVYKASFLVFNALKQEPFQHSDILEAETLLEVAVAMRDPDSELLFYRAIIRYLHSNFQGGLEDMKQCIEKAEDNLAEHYIVRGLCYASLRLYKDAIQDFTIALQLNENSHQVYSYRGRCAYMIDDTVLSFSDFQKFVSFNKSDYKVHIQAAVLLMSAGSYEDAQRALENSISLQYTVKANYLTAKCCVIQNNIPGAICELKRLLKVQTVENANVDLEILSYLHGFLPTQESFSEGLELWENWAKSTTGEIFELKYVLWFRAVFYMFKGKFSKALEDFQLVLELLHSKDAKSLTPDETLTSEEENCEVLYNISLCHIFGVKAQSVLILEDLSEILNNKHKGQMLLLAAIIQLTLGNNVEAEKILKEAFHCDSETVTPFLAKCPVKILPLNTGSSFAEKFPLISVNFPNQPRIEVRPAVSLPRVPLPSLDFSVQTEVKEFFSFRKIQPKPEAPWLNRVRGSIQFTDFIVDVDTEPTEITEREHKEPSRDDEEFEQSKRAIKSMVPLRHYSSKVASRKLENVKKDETPAEIMKKIQELCSQD